MYLLAALVAFVTGACGGSHSPPASAPRITVGATGPLAPGLLTESQWQRVPGFASAKVTTLDQTAVFADPDPRGPCGAKVPELPLRDAAAIAVAADTIRSGAELVVRTKPGVAKQYLDARMADSRQGCPEYATVTNKGVRQRVLLVRIVKLNREFEQALAVVTALKVQDSVRAATQIEVRRGDMIARTVIFSDAPLATETVRGIAALMGADLATVS
jgi:hypothetical protein